MTAKTNPTPRFTASLKRFAFAQGEDGALTFSGTLMDGDFVLDRMFSKQWVRPRTWLAEDGKRVVLSVQHRQLPAIGTFTLRVTKERIDVVDGTFLDTPEALAEAAQFKALQDQGVALEMSLGGYYDQESYRNTRKDEPGDFTFERGTIEEGSVVLTGAADGTSFRMEAGWEPPDLQVETEDATVAPSVYKLSAEELELFERIGRLEMLR